MLDTSRVLNQEKRREWNMQDYGAKGDAKFNNTPVFESVFAQAAVGDTIILGNGIFMADYVRPLKRFRFVAGGPESTILAARSSGLDPFFDWSMPISTVGCALEGLSFDLTGLNDARALRIHNWATGHVKNVKFRKGLVGLDIGNCDQTQVQDLWGINQNGANSATIRVSDASLPNAGLTNIWVSMSQPLTLDAGITVASFCSGLSMDNVWVVNSGAGTMNNGIKISTPVPTGVQGVFAELANVNTDAINGPGLRLENVRGLWCANSFLSSLFQGDFPGVLIDGGKEQQFSNSWISGQGVEFKGTSAVPDKLTFATCTFPQTQVTPAGAFKMTATPTNLVVADDNIYYSSVTDNPSAFLTATGKRSTRAKTKAGIPADVDFAVTPVDGTLAVDTTNNKLYVRIGGTWKGVVVA